MCECTQIIAHTHTSIILTGILTLTHTDQAMAVVVAATAATVRATATDLTTTRRVATCIEEMKRQIRGEICVSVREHMQV